MENIKKNEDKNSIQLNENDILFKKFIKNNQIQSYNPENIINKKNTEDLICSICYNILKNPISCSDKKNSHSFCKECIDIFLKENIKCPLCKLIFEYKNNNNLKNELNELSFNCQFKKEGCNEILFYSDYLDHINNCKYNNIKCECNVKKYDNKSKKFKECGYLGNKKEVEKHFKLCGLTEYKCLICKEKILKINLEEHVKNQCLFRIIHYDTGNRYEGEFKNDLREGYGIFYTSDGDRYEGEFKNELIEGYGIWYFSNGDRYEGEFKNNLIEGYGIKYFCNGERYEGEFKNDLREGYGLMYFYNGNRYEGEFKNDLIEGYGIKYFSNGDRYEGVWKNNFVEGYGIFYSSLGLKVQRYFKYNIKDIFLFFIYKTILFLNNLYLSFVRNKITLLFIIILIIGILIN